MNSSRRALKSSWLLSYFSRSLVIFCGSIVVMFTLSWRLTLVSLLSIPVFAIFSRIYGNYYEVRFCLSCRCSISIPINWNWNSILLQKLAKETQTCVAKSNEVAEEVLSSMKTVRSFANEDGEADRYKSKLDLALAVNRKQAIVYAGYIWMIELFSNVGLIAILWYGGHLVLSDKMSSPQLIQFIIYQLQLGESAGVGLLCYLLNLFHSITSRSS